MASGYPFFCQLFLPNRFSLKQRVGKHSYQVGMARTVDGGTTFWTASSSINSSQFHHSLHSLRFFLSFLDLRFSITLILGGQKLQEAAFGSLHSVFGVF